MTSRVRERQWMYLGPIAATPLAHISVTLYRDAKTPRQKQFLLGFGILGCTAMTLGMRMYLMWHAGYAGKQAGSGYSDRILTVTEEERKTIEHPSLSHVAREAFRGFG